MKDFDAYQKLAALTAIYSKEYTTTYPTLGLCDEAGEVAGIIKRILRGDFNDDLETPKAMLAKELGDVLWYVSAIATDAGLSLSEIAQGNLVKLDDRQRRGALKGFGDER